MIFDLFSIFPWLEAMNSVACFVMLIYMLIVAIVMPGTGMWPNRLIVWSVSGSLALQVISPWAGWVPRIVWHGAVLHIALAAALVIWRKEAMLFIRCKFAPEPIETPMRRTTDIQRAAG